MSFRFWIKDFFKRTNMTKKIEMVVIRHGETESNRTHTIQGHLDTPLSDAQCGIKPVFTYCDCPLW